MEDLIPMDEPVIEGFITGPWYCDTCGQLINLPIDGYVEWLDEDEKSYGLRLVHHKPASPRKAAGGCQYNARHEFDNHRAGVSDMSLRDFLGSAGLMELLSLLQEKNLPEEEVVEMIKRLHIKDYEKARGFFDEALARGVFNPNSPPSIYTPNQIEAVKDFAEVQRAERGY